METSVYEKVLNGNIGTVKSEQALKALQIITKLYPIYESPVKTVDDVFLVCSALNILNAYVKISTQRTIETFNKFYNAHPEIREYLQKSANLYNNNFRDYTHCKSKQDTYKCFKKMVKVLVRQIQKSPLVNDENIQISPQIDGGMSLIMLQVNGVQFSFHRVPIYGEDKDLKDKMNDKSTYIKWKGLRLQPLASHTFSVASHLENLSDYCKQLLVTDPLAKCEDIKTLKYEEELNDK